MKKNVIVYLYSEIMPYQTTIFKEYSRMNCIVHVFYHDKKKQTPYMPPAIIDVNYYKKSSYTRMELLNALLQVKPDILLVCGWNDFDYMYIARYCKKKLNIPIVCPIDTQFLKRLKQYIGFLTSPFYIKRAFTHIWVPGVRQYEFARLLGFTAKNIIFNSLSGDTELFFKASIEKKMLLYPKTFLFVGRFNKVKGLKFLIDVWNSIQDKKGWTITLVGNGPEKDILQNVDGIQVFDFMAQEELLKIAEHSGCFILPSIYEPWALVIHEFAAAGLPILCSDACGASTTFLIDGFNGYVFETGSFNSLKSKMEVMINMDSSDLIEMSYNSRFLANRITPRLSAASFLSIIDLKKSHS